MKYHALNHYAFRTPKVIQTSLIAYAYFARFDRTGRYIATARSDCAAVIWDLDTFSEIRILEGHVGLITDISWSRHSRYVLTASKDWNCIVWDLASDSYPLQRLRTIRFDVPVSRAIFHPKNSNVILVLLVTGEAYVIDCRPGHTYRSEICEPLSDIDEHVDGRSRPSTISCIDFHPTGRLIFASTQNHILVFSTRTKDLIARHNTSNTGSIKHLTASNCGRYFLTNSSDRIIRHYEIPAYPAPSDAKSKFVEQDIEPIYKFADPVDKVSWNAIGYSSDTEWVIGGAADAAKHKIYVWDLSQEGILYETLEGGREPLVDVHWHPTKVAMASTTNRGTVLLWHCPTLEKWSAFAGDFEELDENVEYVEREDEFDIENEEELIERKRKEEEDDVDIDGSDEETLDFYTRNINKGWEEDTRWAEDHPDNDLPTWTMRIILRDEP